MIFVAMPFGKRKDPNTGVEIDFDQIYNEGIRPAAEQFDVDIIRADEERSGGIVHTPMFERLLISEIAIVDVTLENANVFYELGVRHTARPLSTIVIRAHGSTMPFDIRLIRAVLYALEDGRLTDDGKRELNAALAERIQRAIDESEEKPDSPLFELIPQYKGIQELHGGDGVFRERAKFVMQVRQRLSDARILKQDQALLAIQAIARDVGNVSTTNIDSALDVLFALRDIKAFKEMAAYIDTFPPNLKSGQVVREQLGLALNRIAQDSGDESYRRQAIDTLKAVIDERGDNPETCGILGRVYKDLYNNAKRRDKATIEAGGKVRPLDALQTQAHLDDAIRWYRRGFTADPRDFYPGINLLTMLMLKGDANLDAPAREALTKDMQTVAVLLSFALARCDAVASNNYWTLATLIEASVHDNDWPMANKAMMRLLQVDPALQQLETTRDNLRMIAEAKVEHIDADKLQELIEMFEGSMEELQAPAS
jgi:hypothetical protein